MKKNQTSLCAKFFKSCIDNGALTQEQRDKICDRAESYPTKTKRYGNEFFTWIIFDSNFNTDPFPQSKISYSQKCMVALEELYPDIYRNRFIEFYDNEATNEI